MTKFELKLFIKKNDEFVPLICISCSDINLMKILVLNYQAI